MSDEQQKQPDYDPLDEPLRGWALAVRELEDEILGKKPTSGIEIEVLEINGEDVAMMVRGVVGDQVLEEFKVSVETGGKLYVQLS